MNFLRKIIFILYLILLCIGMIINYLGKILIILSFVIIGDFTSIKKKLKTFNQPYN
jgi:hypothetical protein